MRRDSFLFWLFSLSIGAFCVDLAANYFQVGRGGWGIPWAFVRWSSAPPPFARREFNGLALVADVATLFAGAWLCTRVGRQSNRMR
jgi:hypothetical protein